MTLTPKRNSVHIFQGHVSLLFSHSVLSNSLPPHEMQHQGSLSFTISWRMLKLISMELVMASNYLIFYCPFLLLPSVFPRIRVFSMWVTLCIRWPMYWSFSVSIRPSNEYSGLISFRIDKGKGERWIGYPPLNTNQSLNVLTFCQRHYCFWNRAHFCGPCGAGARTWPSTAGRCSGKDRATWGGQSHFYHHLLFPVGSS